MVNGKVVFWNLAKGFGFVESEGVRAFVHTSDLDGGTLKVDADVTYDTTESERGAENEKLKATNVKGAGVVPKPKSEGKLTGTVKKWSAGNSLGFIQEEGAEAGAKDIYVHCSAFGGGNLTVGKTVKFDVEDIEHKSGRKVATNVSGEAVRGVGAKKGTAKKWIHSKGFGFIAEEGKEAKEGDEDEIYVHCSELGGGYLIAGRQVFFDLEERANDEKKRTHAVNLSGPAVRPPDVRSPIGGFGRGGWAVGRGAGGRGGYGRGGLGFGGKGGKGGKGKK